MSRVHRKAQLLLWLILGPAALIGLVLGIASRSEVPTQAAPVVQDLPPSNPPATEVIDR